MRTRKQILTAIVGLFFGASFAVQAAQQTTNNNSQSQEMSSNHHRMMKSCHDNMHSMMQSNENVKATIENAKQSNDPVKMRAALDDAEKSIDSMNQHMNSCMSMMDMMQNMHGMMGEQQSNPKAGNPPKH